MTSSPPPYRVWAGLPRMVWGGQMEMNMETASDKVGNKFTPTFAFGTCGAPAYADAAHRLVNTFDKVTFIVSVHPKQDQDANKVIGVYVFQRVEWVDDDGIFGFRIRWCGERDEPMGAGSHSLAANDASSPAEVSAALAESLTRIASRTQGAFVSLYA